MKNGGAQVDSPWHGDPKYSENQPSVFTKNVKNTFLGPKTPDLRQNSDSTIFNVIALLLRFNSQKRVSGGFLGR